MDGTNLKAASKKNGGTRRVKTTGEQATEGSDIWQGGGTKVPGGSLTRNHDVIHLGPVEAA